MLSEPLISHQILRHLKTFGQDFQAEKLLNNEMPANAESWIYV